MARNRAILATACLSNDMRLAPGRLVVTPNFAAHARGPLARREVSHKIHDGGHPRFIAGQDANTKCQTRRKV